MLSIQNAGPEIVSTNYWQTPYAAKGVVYLSINAGAFRLLLPPALETSLSDMSAKEVIVSRGPWTEEDQRDAIEILFEDGSSSPFVLLFGIQQIDRLPPATDEGRRDMALTVWTNGPRKVLSLPASYRRVSKIPCLEPWSIQRDRGS